MRRLRAPAIAAALATASFATSAAEDVRVQASAGLGQGFTFRASDGRCLLMTADHVLPAGTTGYLSRTWRGAVLHGRAVPAEGLGERAFDVTLAVVTGSLARRCGQYLLGPPRLDAVLTQHGQGALRSVLPDGSAAGTPVSVVDVTDTHLWVQASLPEDTIRQGLSGSSLRLGGERVGLLVTTRPEARMARVLRLDAAVNDAFAALAGAPPPLAPVWPQVVGWTAAPKLGDPQDVLAAGGAAFEGDAVQLTFDLGPDGAPQRALYAPYEVLTQAAVGERCAAPEVFVLSSSDGPDGPWLQRTAVQRANERSNTRMERSARYWRADYRGPTGATCLLVGKVRFRADG